jgi:hypothetical protein
MKPKENSDQRKSRLRKETRQAKEATDSKSFPTKSFSTKKLSSKNFPSKKEIKAELKVNPKGNQTVGPTKPKPRRARKPVSRSAARA